ncbi:thioredoxin family protein [Paenibacillus sp. FSL M7-1455]|jgi:thiol-disulfide isomerase/thioredoxin|uniref:Thioredoxin-like protein YdbP n=1 Tax=Paenibacillus cookii TaxID=157839 RepID=A0ABQ4M115_9BACL|nr:thioredoxin family protein [Paenibacillus cookii]KHF33633.1 Thioredoxin-like protein YdbP [Paenibacillus sp. P1XP2]GIO69210.1 thioredoxin-like protein YdbP [Paenibacillus cookii]HWO55250.1 thioredoxin family protein [Paenibacillus cookii]
MERIQTQQQYEELINRDKLTVIKYDASWCPDCKTLDKFLPDIMAKHADKEFYAMDVEQFEEITSQNEVRGIPSLLVYKNGEKLAHLHSKFAKTPAEISEYLETLESKK